MRPCRKSSVRCHMSFTGLPIVCEISAASSAASKNRWRPNDPPPCDDVARHRARAAGRASARSSAGRRSATSGSTRSRRCPARTSAIAQLVSSGLLLREVEGEVAVDRLGQQRQRRAQPAAARPRAARRGRRRRTCRPRCPAPHVTCSARTASMHCPNVAAAHGDAGGDDGDVGDARASPARRRGCRRATTVPLIVGGRQTIVGSAPGTSRSIANCLRPVTMSSASIRFCGVPTTSKSDVGLQRRRRPASWSAAAAARPATP